jgi:5-methylcytosine-specific restriction endonuclease McrA
MSVLLLNQSYAPHKIINWEKAVTLTYLGKAEVVETTDELIYHSEKYTIYMPSIIRLIKPLGRFKHEVKFSRIGVYTRDNFTCLYCGVQKPIKELNFDHVIPRYLGGKTVWHNVVTSCYVCNFKKANRTPEQAGMQLIRKPYKPKNLPFIGAKFDPTQIPESWAPYCVSSYIP